MSSWYVVQTKSSIEFLAQQNLLNQVNKKIFNREPMNNTLKVNDIITPYGGCEYALI